MSVLLAGLAAVVAPTLLAIWIARQLVRPSSAWRRLLLAAAGGDLSRQVPVQTSDEAGAGEVRLTTWSARCAPCSNKATRLRSQCQP